MNTKKIVSFLLFILIIMCVTMTYAASIPSKNASASKIKEYIDNNDISNVSIPTLLGWYPTIGFNTSLVVQVDTALKNKSSEEIKNYVKNKTVEQLKSETNNNSGLLSTWKDKVTDADTKNKLSKTVGEINEKRKEDQKDASISSQTISPSDFDPSKSQPANNEKSIKLGNKIVGIVQAIGSLVSVGALAVIGIRYMLGSSEEKAEYKSTMIPYIVGAILTFCACHIVSAIYNVMT